jgi:hypothetical protein
MSNEMRAILASVLYFERESKVAPADTAFDLEVAAFFDRLDARAVGDDEETP